MDQETRIDENAIKENLKKTREERGITQAEIAESLKISVTAYQKIERGKTRILNKNFSKCAETLGVSIPELVMGFKPIRDAEDRIADMKESYGMKMRVQERGYIQEIQQRDREIERLNGIIKDKDDTINTQKLLISQLMSKFKD
ncbi:MAG: helix-turn-helix transcriptional regulator [Bacteroidales bacterium]|nr:helix-turn-helix transcriptional regulator [Bacteroidales bacterium]